MAVRTASGAPDDVLYACMGDRSGALRIVPEGTICLCGETLIIWNIEGPVGPAGPAGAQGRPGAPGPQRAQGATGAQGEQGPQGGQVEPGAQGPQGDSGPQGEQGEPGPAGATGPSGASAITIRWAFFVPGVVIQPGGTFQMGISCGAMDQQAIGAGVSGPAGLVIRQSYP
jgi:hypothetical protein